MQTDENKIRLGVWIFRFHRSVLKKSAYILISPPFWFPGIPWTLAGSGNFGL